MGQPNRPYNLESQDVFLIIPSSDCRGFYACQLLRIDSTLCEEIQESSQSLVSSGQECYL